MSTILEVYSKYSWTTLVLSQSERRQHLYPLNSYAGTRHFVQRVQIYAKIQKAAFYNFNEVTKHVISVEYVTESESSDICFGKSESILRYKKQDFEDSHMIGMYAAKIGRWNVSHIKSAEHILELTTWFMVQIIQIPGSDGRIHKKTTILYFTTHSLI